MKLHNRQIKAAFWTDYELQDDMTATHALAYIGLWMVADDSGCLLNDPRAIKRLISPDTDFIPASFIIETIQILLRTNRATEYDGDGATCLFLNNFHEHQILHNCASPTVPLPSWVRWVESDRKYRSGEYEVGLPIVSDIYTETVQILHTNNTETVLGSGSGSGNGSGLEGESEGEKPKPAKPAVNADFEAFWEAYPRHVDKQNALRCFTARMREGHTPEYIIEAAVNYTAACRALGFTQDKIKQPSTFLGPGGHIEEWQVGGSAFEDASTAIRQRKSGGNGNGSSQRRDNGRTTIAADASYAAQLAQLHGDVGGSES